MMLSIQQHNTSNTSSHRTFPPSATSSAVSKGSTTCNPLTAADLLLTKQILQKHQNHQARSISSPHRRCSDYSSNKRVHFSDAKSDPRKLNLKLFDIKEKQDKKNKRRYQTLSSRPEVEGNDASSMLDEDLRLFLAASESQLSLSASVHGEGTTLVTRRRSTLVLNNRASKGSNKGLLSLRKSLSSTQHGEDDVRRRGSFFNRRSKIGRRSSAVRGVRTGTKGDTKQVTFSTVSIAEYTIRPYYHPCASKHMKGGAITEPAIAIDQVCATMGPINIELYEYVRVPMRKLDKDSLKLSSFQREELLMSTCEYHRDEIKQIIQQEQKEEEEFYMTLQRKQQRIKTTSKTASKYLMTLKRPALLLLKHHVNHKTPTILKWK